MNMYYKRQVRCVGCDQFIGEIDCGAKILLPRCGTCSNSESDGNDLLTFMAERFENTVKNIIVSR